MTGSDVVLHMQVRRLFIIHYSLFIIHYSLFITHYSLLIIHYSLFIVHYSLYRFSFTPLPGVWIDDGIG